MRQALLVISILLNTFFIGYMAYTYTNKDNTKSIRLATKFQKDIKKIQTCTDELTIIYALLSKQTSEATEDLNQLATLNSKTSTLAFVSEKDKDKRKRERLISELLQWCNAKQGFHVYIKAQKEQLKILLKRLENIPNEQTLIDVQYTMQDMISTIIKRLYMQSKNLEGTSKRVQNRIDNLRKSIDAKTLDNLKSNT